MNFIDKVLTGVKMAVEAADYVEEVTHPDSEGGEDITPREALEGYFKAVKLLAGATGAERITIDLSDVPTREQIKEMAKKTGFINFKGDL